MSAEDELCEEHMYCEMSKADISAALNERREELKRILYLRPAKKKKKKKAAD